MTGSNHSISAGHRKEVPPLVSVLILGRVSFIELSNAIKVYLRVHCPIYWWSTCYLAALLDFLLGFQEKELIRKLNNLTAYWLAKFKYL